MRIRLTMLLFWGPFVVAAWGQEGLPVPSPKACQQILEVKKLPLKLKTRGPVRRVRWEQIDQVLTDLSGNPQGRACAFKFAQIFRTDREDVFVPVTNNLIRVAPETTLQGISIYRQSGEPAGEYSGRVSYSRKGGLYSTESYTLYHFQYRDTDGELQSSGNHLLLDDYLVRWQDLRDRLAIARDPVAP